jgi:hypothetical protein
VNAAAQETRHYKVAEPGLVAIPSCHAHIAAFPVDIIGGPELLPTTLADVKWFDEHMPDDVDERAEILAALSTLRELSPAIEREPKPCGCCRKVHPGTRAVHWAPENLRRLRDKAAFHWDEAALRSAYRRVLREGRKPAILRFAGARWRDIHSPLASDLLLAISADTDDIGQIPTVARLLHTITHSCLSTYLLTKGATMMVSASGERDRRGPRWRRKLALALCIPSGSLMGRLQRRRARF